MGLLLGLALFGVGLIAIAILVTYPKLPSLDSLQHYKPKMPLTIYSSDGQVIGVYGEQRREFTKIGDFPKILKDAVIAAEDKRKPLSDEAVATRLAERGLKVARRTVSKYREQLGIAKAGLRR